MVKQIQISLPLITKMTLQMKMAKWHVVHYNVS